MHLRLSKLMVASLAVIGVSLTCFMPAFAQAQPQIAATGGFYGASVSGIHFTSPRVAGQQTYAWVGAWNGSGWDFGKWLALNSDGDFDAQTGSINDIASPGHPNELVQAPPFKCNYWTVVYGYDNTSQTYSNGVPVFIQCHS